MRCLGVNQRRDPLANFELELLEHHVVLRTRSSIASMTSGGMSDAVIAV